MENEKPDSKNLFVQTFYGINLKDSVCIILMRKKNEREITSETVNISLSLRYAMMTWPLIYV